METNNDRILGKIRALLNLGSDDAATEAEAANAMRFARRLMLKHNVEQSDLEEAKDVHESAADAERVEYGRVQAETQTTGITNWESTLTWAICKVIGTVSWYVGGKVLRRDKHGVVEIDSDNGKPKTRSTVMFFGPAEDCRDAQSMLQEWSVTVMAMARLRFGTALRGPGRAYCEGFCDELYRNVLTALREEQALIEAQKAQLALPAGATRSTALMVTNATQLMTLKKEKGAEWLEKVAGVKLRNGGSASRGGSYHGDAYGAGREDGSKANISHSRTKKLGGGGK